MKKYFLITTCLLIAGCGWKSTTPDYRLITDQSNYKEYSFTTDPNSGDSSSLVVQAIRAQPSALSYGANEVEINDTEKRYDIGAFSEDQKISANGQDYTLHLVDKTTDTYAVYAGDTKLFERTMCWPASLAADPREIYTVNGKLAVQFFDCDQPKDSDEFTTGPFTQNIYYNGQFLNETYGVMNAQLVFVWNNQIGFIAQEGDEEYVWFNGNKISSGVSIYIQNCCASREWTPTLYDNGTLVFYGWKTDSEESVIIEISLE